MPRNQPVTTSTWGVWGKRSTRGTGPSAPAGRRPAGRRPGRGRRGRRTPGPGRRPPVLADPGDDVVARVRGATGRRPPMSARGRAASAARRAGTTRAPARSARLMRASASGRLVGLHGDDPQRRRSDWPARRRTDRRRRRGRPGVRRRRRGRAEVPPRRCRPGPRRRRAGPGRSSRPRCAIAGPPPPRRTRPGVPPARASAADDADAVRGPELSSDLGRAQHQPVAGAGPGPDGHLLDRRRKPAVPENLVDERMGDQAAVGPTDQDRGRGGGGTRPDASASTAARTVVRQPSTGSVGPGRVRGGASRPIRRRGRPMTIVALRRRWAAGATCCQSQPPQPRRPARARRRDPVGRRLDNLEDLGPGEAVLRLR